MEQVIIVVHILLGLGIVGLILMQQGRGADAGAGFGGGASGSVFGAQGAASFLSRMTAILAALFFSTSLALAWVNGHKSGETVDFMSAPDAQQKASDLVVPKVESAVANPIDAIPQVENKLSSEAPAVTQSPVAPVVPPVQAPLTSETAAPVNPAEEAKPEVKEDATAEKAEEAKSAKEKATESKSTEHHEKKSVRKSKKKHIDK